ncbi:DNA polymerase IV [Nocardia neocaledoniensis NBRC 108232]|uniref:DNA-directed DNA polymerase n=1 Tax=Nocardia neocaledoniensis TaxID=236511 RepID=A0A317NR89_9NOCA|nr:DNA polymerase IV [Nocardia neocaledoniensis]PWV76238.1 DNA polymerase-4 [Nocardia neocaledoniensis]GEM31238.1 DNA polymerase IV [Nocardia neocaledoniensis NBRC 108232]
MPQWLLHVDLDQFQAAVEFRRRPELRGQPVIVGGEGDPDQPRKVVTCASYPARAFGVRAGMPLKMARRKCPDGVFLPVDMAAYEQASEEIMATLGRVAGDVEVWGMDEAFVATDDDPWLLAAEVRRAVVDLGLTCSVGIGDNKLTAKLATGFAKSTGKTSAEPEHDPGAAAGIFELTAANWAELMGHRPTDALWGVGARIAKRMAELGITTVAELMAADRQRLAAEFGPNTGPYLWVLGHGKGDTELTTVQRIPIGRSKSETFPRDLTDPAEIRHEVARIATEVAEEMREHGRTSTRVSVTVRTKTFYTRSKQKKLPQPTDDVPTIVDTALTIIDRFDLDRPVRLLGVRLELLPLDT